MWAPLPDSGELGVELGPALVVVADQDAAVVQDPGRPDRLGRTRETHQQDQPLVGVRMVMTCSAPGTGSPRSSRSLKARC